MIGQFLTAYYTYCRRSTRRDREG